jgi:hypothetical protein
MSDPPGTVNVVTDAMDTAYWPAPAVLYGYGGFGCCADAVLHKAISAIAPTSADLIIIPAPTVRTAPAGRRSQS